MHLAKTLAVSLLISLFLPVWAGHAIEPDAPERLISSEEALSIRVRLEIDRMAPARDAGERRIRSAIAGFHAKHEAGLVWIDGRGLKRAARAVAEEMSEARSWGLNPRRYALDDLRLDDGQKDWTIERQIAAEIAISRAVLSYARDAQGGRVAPSRLSLDFDRRPPLLAPSRILSDASSTQDPAAFLRGLHPQHEQFQRLRAAYVELLSGKDVGVPEETGRTTGKRNRKRRRKRALTRKRKLRKVLANMEMWRWMPRELGTRHVWANIPAYHFRVVDRGRTILRERMVVGKPKNKTPIFSDQMELVVFKPYWAVPNSIKVKELLPRLLRGAGLRGLKISAKLGGREINPYAVDWSRKDIRNYIVYQPPGGRNALGRVKFLFPNRHAIYMHDTPSKYLFKRSQRAYSHGCMRVRNPLKLAQVLLAADRGWNRAKIVSLTRSGPNNNEVRLRRKVPVHVVYFTAMVSDSGKLLFYDDVYGHERLIHLGLSGKALSLPKPVKEDLSAVRSGVLAKARRGQRLPFGTASRSALGAATVAGQTRRARGRPAAQVRRVRRSRVANRGWRRNVFGGSDR